MRQVDLAKTATEKRIQIDALTAASAEQKDAIENLHKIEAQSAQPAVNIDSFEPDPAEASKMREVMAKGEAP